MSIAKSNSLISQEAAALAQMLHWRWALPVLSLLWLEQGAKFVFLVHRLNISRDALSRTLTALIELGYVEKNPGYGHPLRPEYLLTIGGESIAPAATHLLQHLREGQLESIALNKWSLPALWVVGQNPSRYSEIQKALKGISPRALALCLDDLEQAGLLIRDQQIRPSYALSESGQRVRALLKALNDGLQQTAETTLSTAAHPPNQQRG